MNEIVTFGESLIPLINWNDLALVTHVWEDLVLQSFSKHHSGFLTSKFGDKNDPAG